MHYNPNEIEPKWQKEWSQNGTYKVDEDSNKEKFYVLDMFPYPSGAGLHVGHPLGYIASDIYARYMRLKGYNVLHPMGYDSFGLPAEQYAIQTGQHPAKTTEINTKRYREQLDKIGFSFDWSREVKTSNPDYYKWTQWIFCQLFNAWYDQKEDKARKIEDLIATFEKSGNTTVEAACDEDTPQFSADEWNAMSEKEQQAILLHYRIAFLSEAEVNWCPALGTVLSNDEVKDGLSERGGHPVERKKMMQWSMRISAYAERLLQGLEKLDWSDAIKEIQRNWIGKSKGAELSFQVEGSKEKIKVFTTRPDTIFGVNFMVLAPESELTQKLTTAEQKEAVEAYIKKSAQRSERDRMADVKSVSGVFTGSYAIHPFTGNPIPIWVGDYVLAGYGTGAVMAVPAHDSRDYAFATHFDMEKPQVVEPKNKEDIKENEAIDSKEGTMINSDFLNGLSVQEAIQKAIEKIEEHGIGSGKINYKMRDAIFSRQRYWGEPIPVYYKDGMPYLIDESELPLTLPEVDKYLPTEDGEPPLARAENWKYQGKYDYEHSTMPGWAGSSWYFFRYMDPKNKGEFAGQDKLDYWGNVDLYMGGAEHATGHLLYARFWTKFLYDLGHVKVVEPFQKMINQGMIQGRSAYIHRLMISSTGAWQHPEDNGRIISAKMIPPIYISANKRDIIKRKFNGETDIDLIMEFDNIDQEIEDIIQRISQEINEKFSTVGDFDYELEYLQAIPVDIKFVDNDTLDVDALRTEASDEKFKNAIFVREEDGTFSCSREVEKMSKSKYNVVNPDELIEQYGADTLRMYEMFLGPIEQHKPWDTKGITGVSGFLKKFWRLFHTNEGFAVSDEEPNKDELKILHKTIKKVQEDIERYSFNTVVSEFMICANELTALKCSKRAILEPLVVLLSPYAPHIAEELWMKLGNKGSVTKAKVPEYNEAFLVEDSFEYPVSFNGKMRFKMELSTSLSKEEVEKEVLAYDKTAQYLEGKAPKKVIVVPKRIVNIVV